MRGFIRFGEKWKASLELCRYLLGQGRMIKENCRWKDKLGLYNAVLNNLHLEHRGLILCLNAKMFLRKRIFSKVNFENGIFSAEISCRWCTGRRKTDVRGIIKKGWIELNDAWKWGGRSVSLQPLGELHRCNLKLPSLYLEGRKRRKKSRLIQIVVF